MCPVKNTKNINFKAIHLILHYKENFLEQKTFPIN